MAEIWKPNPENCLHYWIAITNEVMDDLNAWELKFMGSIEYDVINKMPLTHSQEMKLEQIYARYTS